jgi:putative spermidine/putrescine transport system ATP-binding protein
MGFLDLTDVRKEFAGGTTAVEGFNLKAEKGEFVSFLGPSGCGKTTTLRMISGFERPTSGSITVDGADITNKAPHLRNVGMVFQSYALFPNMTVAGNIGYGLRIRKRPSDQINKRVEELLGLINLAGRGNRYPWQLSGGQQQRVALARALAIEPQVLLLDEPLSALDAKIRVQLREQIRALQRQLGITTIYVTHDQEEALSLSDRIVVMSDGRIEQIGTPAEIYNFPATTFVAKFVGSLNVVTAKVADGAAGTVTVDEQPIRTFKPFAGAVGSDVVLALRPEVVTIVHEGDAPSTRTTNRLQAAVDEVTFLGSVVRTRVKLPGGTTLNFDTFNDPNATPPALGSSITIGFPAEGCLVLAD